MFTVHLTVADGRTRMRLTRTVDGATFEGAPIVFIEPCEGSFSTEKAAVAYAAAHIRATYTRERGDLFRRVYH